MSIGESDFDIGAFESGGLAFADVLNRLSEGVYITDIDRRILFWSKRAEEITGWPAHDVVGKHCRDNILCHTDAHGRPLCNDDLCPLKRAMDTKSHSPSPVKIFAQTPQGGRICVSVSVAPLFDSGGSVAGAIEIFRDETDSERQKEFAASVQKSLRNFGDMDDSRIEFGFISEPADEVNGDYCNVFKLNDSIYGLVVCDAVGHGIASALVSTMIHSFLIENLGLWIEPSSALANMNERLCALSGLNVSATASLAMINLATGELTASHAGAPPIVVLRNSEIVFVGEAGGLPCGMFDRETYEQESFQLNRGDHIILYSDGALEVKTDYGKLLGYDGLYDLFKELGEEGGKDELDKIKAKIVRSSAEVALKDDFTIAFAKLL